MGWTGCFPHEDSLQRLPLSIRRSSSWTPPHGPSAVLSSFIRTVGGRPKNH